MLRDELRNERDERWDEVANLEVQYGTCRFCGQLATIHPLLGPWDQDKLDECASEICGCETAKLYSKRKERLEQAAKLIDMKFGHSSQEDDYFIDDCNDVCELLNTVARAVIYEKVGKTSVRINAKIKCDISLNSKTGKIKIERTIIHKDTEEA